MRKEPLLYGLGCLMLLFSCNNPSGSSKEHSALELVTKAGENYSLGKLRNGHVSNSNGVIAISDSVFKYVLETKGIVYGRIDADTLTDAVLPVKVFHGVAPVRVEHIVLLKSEKGFNHAATMNKIFKVRRVESNSIVAEYTDLPFDSPIYGCTECIRVYKYKLEGKDLVKTDSLKYTDK